MRADRLRELRRRRSPRRTRRAAAAPAGSAAAAARPAWRCSWCCRRAGRCIPTHRARWRGCTRPPRSIGHGSAPASTRRRIAVPEPPAHVAEIAGLAAVDVFADAAGEHHAVDPAEIEDRIGEIEMLDRVRHRPLRQRGHEFVGHGLGDACRAASDRSRRPCASRSRPAARDSARPDRAARWCPSRRPPAGGRRHGPPRSRSRGPSRRPRAWWCRRRCRC